MFFRIVLQHQSHLSTILNHSNATMLYIVWFSVLLLIPFVAAVKRIVDTFIDQPNLRRFPAVETYAISPTLDFSCTLCGSAIAVNIAAKSFTNCTKSILSSVLDQAVSPLEVLKLSKTSTAQTPHVSKETNIQRPEERQTCCQSWTETSTP